MSVREHLTVALARVLIVWYRLRLALPRPVGGHALLLRRLLAWKDSGRSARAGEARELAELFRRATGRLPIAASCVPRSLALIRLLRLNGLAAGLRVGLRRTDGRLVGHAWVEHDGVTVGDDVAFVRAFHPLVLVGQARPGEAA